MTALRDDAITTITNALAAGTLRHPKNPATALVLPGLQTTGMPPEMAAAVHQTLHDIAEALISLVETRHNAILVNKTELQTLRER
jgi:hypothetical protein